MQDSLRRVQLMYGIRGELKSALHKFNALITDEMLEHGGCTDKVLSVVREAKDKAASAYFDIGDVLEEENR